ncbi:Phloem protein [Parasponia andersonii]|uniref:Phloem protein n=1 Tax=Parasponia andersonii TaxID=3476 RepID=A0A2P5B1D7_PARAD|nr:Phloem protein [Parasponia andersonii]
MLSARELSITWASHPLYWTWKQIPESRFSEVAELIIMWWLEICGTMNTKMLSPKTVYAAYLIVKFADRAYGLDFLSSEVSVEVGHLKSQRKVNLNRLYGRKQPLQHVHLLRRSRLLQHQERGALCKRKNGWIEIELESFYHDGNGEEVKMRLR